ncbi:hypothetical protein Hanom_Chr03g00245981 [Helianthus anomalus]
MSPEKPVSGDAQHANSSQGPRLDNQRAGEENGRPEELNEAACGGTNNHNDKNGNILENGREVSQLFNKEPPLPPCGSSEFNNGDNSLRKDIIFFNSSDHHVRPKKRQAILRPRNKAQSQVRMPSPLSNKRPRKRPRDNGPFNFDLNVD